MYKRSPKLLGLLLIIVSITFTVLSMKLLSATFDIFKKIYQEDGYLVGIFGTLFYSYVQIIGRISKKLIEKNMK